jgi:hypothetical protein
VVTLMVALEARFVRDRDGRICSTTGVDGYEFWQRYLEVFDRVLVAARTSTSSGRGLTPVAGPAVEVVPLPDYRGPWGYVRTAPRLARALRGRRPCGLEVVGDPAQALAPGAVDTLARPLARVALVRSLRRMCRDATAVAYVTEGTLQARYPTPGGWTG